MHMKPEPFSLSSLEKTRAPQSKLEQITDFLKEAWPVRNVDALSQRITAYQQEHGPIPEIVRSHYKKEREQLVDFFGDPLSKKLDRNLLFHGTGLLKYRGEKFQGTIEHGLTVPVLEQILANGIEPQHDPFLPEGDVYTTSLVESYFYAKWFADKHMVSADEMQFQFGKPNDWFTFFLADTGKWALENLSQLVTRYFFNREKIRDAQKSRQSTISPIMGWASGTRNDVKTAMTYREMLRDILDGHSTIRENWGAMLCIDKEQVTTRNVGAHETRTNNRIPPEAIVALGVPLRRLHEANLLFENVRSQAIVFSLESAEIFLSQFPMEELAKRLE